MQRYAAGENQTTIARQEQINRETVARIVKCTEMESHIEHMRERWRALCDDAIEGVRKLIRNGDKQAIFRVLESNGIIASQGQAQNIIGQPATKPSGDARVQELTAKFAEVAIERARVFRTPFPGLAEIAEQHDIKLGFELDASDEAEQI